MVNLSVIRAEMSSFSLNTQIDGYKPYSHGHQIGMIGWEDTEVPIHINVKT